MTSFHTDLISWCEGRRRSEIVFDSRFRSAAVRRGVLFFINSAIFIGGLSLCMEPPAYAAKLEVLVKGVRNTVGMVKLCVFNTPQGFPNCSNSLTMTSQSQHAKSGTVQFDFDVNPGLHAVSALHDENDNGRLDTNFLGIPREGVGVSNNPPPRRGPPLYTDAEFRLSPDGGEIVVNLVYP